MFQTPVYPCDDEITVLVKDDIRIKLGYLLQTRGVYQKVVDSHPGDQNRGSQKNGEEDSCAGN